MFVVARVEDVADPELIGNWIELEPVGGTLALRFTALGEGAASVGVVLAARKDLARQPAGVIEFRLVDGDGAPILAYAFNDEFGIDQYTREFLSLEVPSGRYELHVEHDDKTCRAELDLTNGVDRLVHATDDHPDCLLQIEELEPWMTLEGDPVTSAFVEEFFGGGHCSWQDVRVIALGGYFQGDAYAMDPSGTFPDWRYLTTAARDSLGLGDLDVGDRWEGSSELGADDILTFETGIELPDDAVSLGYRRGDRELFQEPDGNGDYLYVVSPRGTERWPRLKSVPACA